MRNSSEAHYTIRQCMSTGQSTSSKTSLKDLFSKYLFLGAGIALGYGLDDRVFKSRYGLGIFLFTTVSRPALGPIMPPIQWAWLSLWG
jgi:hypothetical protein